MQIRLDSQQIAPELQTATLVSVVMAVYRSDHPLFVHKAIMSILTQTYPYLELVLVQDGPLTPELDQLLRGLEPSRNCRIQHHVLPQSRGAGRARNEGIALALGTYIAIMDADDISFPDRIVRQLQLMRQEGCDVVGSNYQIIDDLDCIVGLRSLPTDHLSIKKAIAFYNPICNPAVLAKAAVLKRYPYEEAIRFGEDYRLWMRLMLNGYKFSNHPEPLLSYRQGARFHTRRRGVMRAFWDMATKCVALRLVRVHVAPFVVVGALSSFLYRLLPSPLLRHSYELRQKLTKLLMTI